MATRDCIKNVDTFEVRLCDFNRRTENLSHASEFKKKTRLKNVLQLCHCSVPREAWKEFASSNCAGSSGRSLRLTVLTFSGVTWRDFVAFLRLFDAGSYEKGV